MKNLNNNKGVTLVELVVSLAILALLATAVVGVMNSNTMVFRKNKTDLVVQTDAQTTYNKIYEELMQAKHVYIEGYVSDTDIPFSASKKGETNGTGLTEVKLMRQSDINLMKLSKHSPSTGYYLDPLKGTPTVSREAAAESYTSSYNEAQKNMFDSFYNTVRFMDDYEIDRYGEFIDIVKVKFGGYDPDTYTAFDDVSIKGGDISSGFTFKNIYITKIYFLYTLPVDHDYVENASDVKTYEYEPGKTAEAPDFCRVIYNFEDGEFKINETYGAMKKLNTVRYTGGDEYMLYSDNLNYVNNTVVGKKVSGVVAQIDGANDGIKIDLYFADKNMSYTDRGMMVLRNSYVLHDSK